MRNRGHAILPVGSSATIQTSLKSAVHTGFTSSELRDPQGQERQAACGCSLRACVLPYQSGWTLSTEISRKPNPRMPSNLAARNARPGSLVASAKVCRKEAITAVVQVRTSSRSRALGLRCGLQGALEPHRRTDCVVELSKCCWVHLGGKCVVGRKGNRL